jgi:hypothetical protein
VSAGSIAYPYPVQLKRNPVDNSELAMYRLWPPTEMSTRKENKLFSGY